MSGKVYGFWKLNVCRSYPYACGDPAQNERIRLMGYLKGKSSLMLYEQFGDLNSNTGTGSSGAEGTTSIRWVKHGEDTGLHKAPA